MFKIGYFSDFKKDILMLIADKLTLRYFQIGECLMKEGDLGDCMFILMQGQADVCK